ncbi:MAG: type IV pili methyl-accepting chemotaxis transducer N-terminal domain-containing protein [Burkholderiaceae bacterium]|jgi:two-component system nitrate/nitrite sensor histidine kinase NarX|nr:type IV pili methyl-accepting chemotaxis transducer N-terminal domain-containing protein [Burkholderiaceae bacterium]MCO5104153.1 type IV pili methyl-accepting chemotaxis transducer N-terminal domain-containing protein [Burkholderiaceae bacterium]
MRSRTTLTTKLLTMGMVFLLVTLSSISLTLWVTWKLEGGAAAVNEAGRLRMRTMRMALAAENGARDKLLANAQKIEASLELLRTGDPDHPLYVPWSDETRARFDEVRSQWAAVREEWLAPQAPPVPVLVARADAVAEVMNRFVDAIEVQIARWTAALHVLQLFMMGLTLLAAFGAMVVTGLVVINPVARLQEALLQIRQGALGTRLPVDTDDEFGQLNEGFNRMAQALQASHEDLALKVREKTASIEDKNQRLSALYEVSAMAAQAPNLQALTQGFVRQVRRAAHADAAVVRWSDEGNEHYVILAADGLPQATIDQEQCLRASNCFCGQTPSRPDARVIPISSATPMVLPHCHEAGYQTLVVLPVMVHQRVLAELNLFFRSSLELSADMRELLEAMVRHLASSMEGLRAAALEREGAVAEERGMLARELHDSIAQSLAFLKIQTQLLRDAVKKGNDAARDRSMAELDAGVRECYADVRELLVHFRTRASEEDIEEALRTTLSKFGHQTGIATHLAMEGHGLPLDADVQIQVLHMVQEALSNVRKHARATRVELRVRRHPAWRFEVQDDGIGFDAGRTLSADSLHVGLRILHERAEGIGAQVHVRSAPGLGTTVCIELPHPASAAPAGPVSELPAPKVPAWSSV